ncbi:MAG: hypothetical protein WHV63_02750 [Ignavibacteria bacterium]|jgi:hypothetical protein|nr:hypothetical protein [Ignavibacteria bacterium]MDH7528605.1 hypothetical protein [Ignavibacteria bacterium]
MKLLIQQFLIFLHSKKKSQFDYFTARNIFKNSSNILVLIPEQKELLKEISFIIRVLQNFPKQISFLIESSLFKELNFEPSENFILYSKKDKNFIDLPTRNLIDRLQQRGFDLVIDFNLDASNFHYWITKNLNAKFKFGLYRKNSTLFNNLVMKVNNIENVRSIYENFLFLLKL